MNKGILLTLTTAIVSGVSIFINQFGVKVVNPYIFTGLKNIMVAVLLFSCILLIKKFKDLKSLTTKDWLSLIIIGLIGGSLPFLMFFKGLSISTGPEASYLHKFMFVFIILLAPIFLKEKFRWPYLIGFVSLIIGSAMLYKINGQIAWNNGDTLILGATILWAVENIIAKKVLSRLSGTIVGWGRMFFGSLFIVLFWAFTNQLGSLANLNISQINWVLLTGALLFAYVATWYAGLKRVPISLAAAILALGAPVTSLLELAQGKDFTANQIFGIVLMFCSVVSFIVIEKICSRSKTPVTTR